MVNALRDYFGARDEVEAADVHDYGLGYPVRDYLAGPDPRPVEWTITNPPFRLAEEFVSRALRTSTDGVAVLVRTGWLEGAGRYHRLFSTTPPSEILQFCERVVMLKGRVSATGSTATAYAWVIWRGLAVGPRAAEVETKFRWIQPGTRRRLEMPSDYDEIGHHAG